MTTLTPLNSFTFAPVTFGQIATFVPGPSLPGDGVFLRPADMQAATLPNFVSPRSITARSHAGDAAWLSRDVPPELIAAAGARAIAAGSNVFGGMPAVVADVSVGLTSAGPANGANGTAVEWHQRKEAGADKSRAYYIRQARAYDGMIARQGSLSAKAELKAKSGIALLKAVEIDEGCKAIDFAIDFYVGANKNRFVGRVREEQGAVLAELGHSQKAINAFKLAGDQWMEAKEYAKAAKAYKQALAIIGQQERSERSSDSSFADDVQRRFEVAKKLAEGEGEGSPQDKRLPNVRVLLSRAASGNGMAMHELRRLNNELFEGLKKGDRALLEELRQRGIILSKAEWNRLVKNARAIIIPTGGEEADPGEYRYFSRGPRRK